MLLGSRHWTLRRPIRFSIKRTRVLLPHPPCPVRTRAWPGFCQGVQTVDFKKDSTSSPDPSHTVCKNVSTLLSSSCLNTYGAFRASLSISNSKEPTGFMMSDLSSICFGIWHLFWRGVGVCHQSETQWGVCAETTGRSGRSGKGFKKGEGCCGIRQGTMLLSKKLYNEIYRYISGILYTLPTAFRSGNTHTPHSPRQHAKVHPVEPVLPRLDANCNLRSKHQSPTPTSRSVPCVRIHALSVESFTPVMITSEEMKRQEAVKELHEMAGLSGTLMAVSDENEYFHGCIHP